MNIQREDRPLRRRSGGRLVAGGLAEYLDVEVTVVRPAFVVLGLGGIGLPLYAAAWLLIPSEQSDASLAPDLLARHQGL